MTDKSDDILTSIEAMCADLVKDMRGMMAAQADRITALEKAVNNHEEKFEIVKDKVQQAQIGNELLKNLIQLMAKHLKIEFDVFIGMVKESAEAIEIDGQKVEVVVGSGEEIVNALKNAMNGDNDKGADIIDLLKEMAKKAAQESK